MDRTSIDSILTSESDNDNLDSAVLIDGAYFHIARVKGALCAGNVQVDRVLSALLDNAIDGAARLRTAKAICAAASGSNEGRKDRLLGLAQAWLDHLIYPVPAAGRKRIQSPSEEQTPTLQSTVVLIDSASQGGQKALVALLNRREGDRCLVARALGLLATGAQSDEHVAPLNAAHVLPFSLNDVPEDDPESLVSHAPVPHVDNAFEGDRTKRRSAITWDMLKAWTSLDVQKWAGQKINGPENAILVRAEIHYMFERFKWWFTPTDEPLSYVVNSRISLEYKGRRVKLGNHSRDSNIPLPDQDILALHAAFANVVYASSLARWGVTEGTSQRWV